MTETKRKNGPPGVPITIQGVTYPSHRAAARALGVTPGGLSLAKSRGRLDTVGSRNRHGQQEKETDQ